ncbi:2'-5'-oligoadenylate synthase 1-like [Porites lutea]|uniref:2'-5'-oligoadenylate synthase 1-like n=1 Tax=Porites lutea TaxID=51062 RepID=UPI003CC5BBC1
MASRSKPFECTVCSKRFTTAKGRAAHHRAVHNGLVMASLGSKPFECTVCSKRFSTGDGRASHQIAVHVDKGDLRENSNLDLNKFICDELQPNEEFNRLLNGAIDSLYRELQRELQHTKYGIHNLIKGGSIAKGTAIKNNSDLDCVMVMNGIENASQLSSKLPDILPDLESRLRSWTGGSWQLDSIERTNFSVQFNMSRSSEESVKVDLLPTFRIEDIDERKRVYKEMRGDKKIRPYCSAALVRSQVEFVEKQPPNVKDLIRLVKYWRKTYIPQIGHERLPPSYLLELLTIHAWEKAKCPTTFDMKIGFKAVMKLLKVHYKLRVYWGDYYGKDVITCSLKSPHVIDPANPTNNLYSDVNCWRKVRKTAEKTMRKPLLSDVQVTDNWS